MDRPCSVAFEEVDPVFEAELERRGDGAHVVRLQVLGAVERVGGDERRQVVVQEGAREIAADDEEITLLVERVVGAVVEAAL